MCGVNYKFNLKIMLKVLNYLKYSAILLPLTVLAQTEPEAPVTSICDVYDLILKIVNYLLIFAIVIGVLYMIIGAFHMITGGDEGKKKGKGMVYSVIIGIVIALLAWSLIAYVIPSFLGLNYEGCMG